MRSLEAWLRGNSSERSTRGAVRRAAALAAAALVLFISAYPQEPVNRSPEARKVFDALDRLKRAEKEPRPAGAPARTIVLTDREFNAYIGHRIRTEKAGPLKDLRLKFLPGNRIEGLMFLDLARLGAPAILPDTLHFYFAGRLAVEGGRMRLEVRELFLEFKPVPVFLLNMAFYIASKTQKHGPTGLGDWRDLPLGLEGIAFEAGRVILSY